VNIKRDTREIISDSVQCNSCGAITSIFGTEHMYRQQMDVKAKRGTPAENSFPASFRTDTANQAQTSLTALY